MSMCTVWLSYSKWLRQSNESASNFELSLNIPLQNLFGWFRRPQPWATGDWQLHHDNMPAHVSRLVQSVLAKHKSPRWLSPLQPRFGALQLLAFPKTKITFEREEVSDHLWDSRKYDEELMVIGRTVWGPKVPALKGTEVSLPYIQYFLYVGTSHVQYFLYVGRSCIFFNKCLYFSYYITGYLLDRPHILLFVL